MPSGPNDQYKIVINWDEGAMYSFCPMQAASERDDVDAEAIKGMLEEIVDEHAKAGVDVLAHGVFSGFFSMMPYPRLHEPADGGRHIPASSEEHHQWCQKYGKFWLTGFKKLRDAGLDLVEIVLARCHHNDMQFVVAFRMNDRHAGSGQETTYYPRIEQWKTDHPEWLLEEHPGGVDYKYEGVRNAVLEFVAEAIERYDLDGIELDWMRWCHMFKSSEAAENAPLLTDFIGKVRKMLDDAAAERGRDRLPLGVRIAQSLDECANLGYDIATWIKDGLVDYICPTDFYFTDPNTPIDDFVNLTEGTACKIYPGIHPSIAWQSDQTLMGLPEYAAAAQNFYAYGAHGVSPYNFMYHWGKVRSPSYPGPVEMWPNAFKLLTALKSADEIAASDRHYLFHPCWTGHRDSHCPTGAYRHNIIVLDRSTDDPRGTFTFRIAEDLTDDSLSATLEFKITYMIAADQLEIAINGDVVPDDALERQWYVGQSPQEGRPLAAHFLYRIPLGSPPAKFGDNVITMRLTNRVGMTQRRLMAQEFEVFVRKS
ncbi:MAG TPA: hypothetical protein DIT01_01640 [Lentisphaeria bacterium]|mgnify:CR=1 FL=1|nr:hypothetical protein [Lentisphaeria bacterium]